MCEVRIGDGHPTSPSLSLSPRAGVFIPLLERGIDEAEETLVCMLTLTLVRAGVYVDKSMGMLLRVSLTVDKVFWALWRTCTFFLFGYAIGRNK